MSANVWVFTFASVPRSPREHETTKKPKELKFEVNEASKKAFQKLQL